MSPLKSKLNVWNKHWLEWTRTLSWILWASGAAGQRTVGVGRGCRLWQQGGGWEEGQIPWASGLDTHVRKTLPRVQRLSPWPCFVWKSHRLSKVGSLSSFRRPSAKVAKAGCSTAYIVTFKAKIWDTVSSKLQARANLNRFLMSMESKPCLVRRESNRASFYVMKTPITPTKSDTICELSYKILKRRDHCHFCCASKMTRSLLWYWWLIL